MYHDEHNINYTNKRPALIITKYRVNALFQPVKLISQERVKGVGQGHMYR